MQCKPDKAIRTLNTDIEVDFCPPKDYKEPPKVKKENNLSGSSIKFNSNEKVIKKLTPEEIKQQIEDKKFSGHHFRMDGKQVTNTQVNKIMKAKLEQKNNEENYNPRNCRIPSNPRPCFKYVEL